MTSEVTEWLALLRAHEGGSSDLVIAMRLLDHLKLRGFQFLRSALTMLNEVLT